MITRTEHVASIAYDAFCRSICKTPESTDHYTETFFYFLDSDIRRAWVAATAAVIEAIENEKKTDSTTTEIC